jgi:hypothetical protein
MIVYIRQSIFFTLGGVTCVSKGVLTVEDGEPCYKAGPGTRCGNCQAGGVIGLENCIFVTITHPKPSCLTVGFCSVLAVVLLPVQD